MRPCWSHGVQARNVSQVALRARGIYWGWQPRGLMTCIKSWLLPACCVLSLYGRCTGDGTATGVAYGQLRGRNLAQHGRVLGQSPLR